MQIANFFPLFSDFKLNQNSCLLSSFRSRFTSFEYATPEKVSTLNVELREDGRKLLFFLYEAQPCSVQSFCSNRNKSVAFQRLVRLLVEEGNLVLSNKLMT